MKSYYLLFVVLLTLSCNSKQNNKNKKSTRYFSNITGIISPYMDYNPRGELDTIKANNFPYYKVNYLPNGNISDISYFKYNSKNNESYFGTHQVVYSYKKDSLIRNYFDAKGRKSYMSRHYYGGGNIHEEVFTLNNSGFKKELILKDSINQRVATGFGTFVYKWNSQNTRDFIQEQYKENGNANVLTTYFPFYKSVISIDEKGHLFSITNLDTLSGKPVESKLAGYSKVLFDFDTYGNEKGWSFHDLDDKLKLRKQAFNLEHGYAKVVYDFNWENEKLGLSKSFVMRFLDSNQVPVLNSDGIHSTIFETDKNDNLISMSYYDTKEEPLLHPVAKYYKVTISYDDKGKRQQVLTYDEKSSLIKK